MFTFICILYRKITYKLTYAKITFKFLCQIRSIWPTDNLSMLNKVGLSDVSFFSLCLLYVLHPHTKT